MIKIISHRGNDINNFDENTKEAIVNSLSKNYIDGVEIDVRITKDKKIIVFHDMVIFDRHKIYFIKNISYKKIKKINPKIATLEFMLNNINTDKKVIIEIKEELNNYEKTCDIIYNIIKKYNHLDIYLCSFNYDLINYFYIKYNYKKLGILISMFLNTDKKNNKFYFNSFLFTHLDNINFNKEIMLWGIKTDYVKNIIKKLNNLYSNYDIDIITDDPAYFIN